MRTVESLFRIKKKDKALKIFKELGYVYPGADKVFSKGKGKGIVDKLLGLELQYLLKFGRIYSVDAGGRDIMVLVHSKYRNLTKARMLRAFGLIGFLNRHRMFSDEEKQQKTKFAREMEVLNKEISLPEEYIFMKYLGVREDFRKQGRGSSLANTAIRHARKSRLPLVTCVSSMEDVGFYQNRGFKVIGITSSKELEIMHVYLIKEY